MWSALKDASDFITHCHEQAEWCRQLGSPLTAALCEAFARDAQDGGIVAELAEGVAPPHRKRATSLRLAGALHYGVLSGRAPELAAQYTEAGDDWAIEPLWTAAEAYLRRDRAHVAAFIMSDPQTNETRRSIALLPGFLEIAARFGGPFHVLELGASAGLNQNFERFNYAGGDWSRAGDSGVDISTDWDAPVPDVSQVIEVAAESLHVGGSARALGAVGCGDGFGARGGGFG